MRGLISRVPPATPIASLEISMPSTKVAALGRPRVGDKPRITSRVSEGAKPRSNCRLESWLAISLSSLTPARSMSSRLMAFTAMGMSCRFSSFFRVVTMISSIIPSFCAGAGIAISNPMPRAMDKDTNRVRDRFITTPLFKAVCDSPPPGKIESAEQDYPNLITSSSRARSCRRPRKKAASIA